MSPSPWYFVVAYLVGAIPTGQIAAILSGRGPLFAEGHRRNPDLRGVFELLGFRLALLVTLIDIGKGWVLMTGPVIRALAGEVTVDRSLDQWWVVALGAVLVVIGHCHSIFLGFKGGRGLATTFGVILCLLPVPALGCLLLWAILSFWGLSTNPGALSASGALPLLAVPYVWFVRPDLLYSLYVVAFFALWGLWESREGLAAYLGLARVEAAEPTGDPPAASPVPPDAPPPEPAARTNPAGGASTPVAPADPLNGQSR